MSVCYYMWGGNVKNKPIVASVVDPDTGEIIDTISAGDRIVRKESSDSYRKNIKKHLKEEPTYQRWDLDDFYRANISELTLLMDDLSQFEKAFLFSISPYVSYEESALKYKNNADIGTEHLIKITGMSRTTVYKTIDSLIKKDIIYRGMNSRSRQYFVNPWIFSKGSRINKVLKIMFGNYEIRLLGNKKWKDI